ncbi:MAG: T9SS type A sorting domain-containing protein [Saprospiraceae bacterium]|nr:T9SS type A sorting domain-containing protein [Saprospiraceae bacterium]MBK8668390.1 T9SS type A sorting domain-containing protein [Saprospiraceae bacterium]
MKNLCSCILIMMIFHFLPSNATSQSTFDLFSRKGLVIGSAWFGDIGDWGISGSAYDGIDTVCGGKKVLRYIYNDSSHKFYIYYYINGDKVYRHYNCDSEELLYDFGMQIGQTIKLGINNEYTLIEKFSITLLNGDIATKYILQNGFSDEFEWINGIGIVSPISGLPSNVFVCAKLNGVLLIEKPLSPWTATHFNIDCDLLTCVKPKPDYSSVINDNEVSFDNTSSYGDEYFWSFGDGFTSTEKSPTHTYAQKGCYIASLKVTNACFPEGYTIKNSLAVCTEDAFIKSENIPLSYYSSFCKVNDNILFYIFGSNLYRSNNGGETWTKQPILSDLNEERQALEIKMWDDKRGIMGTNNLNYKESNKCVMITEDGGVTWQLKVDGSYWVDNIVLDTGGIAWVSAGRYRDYYYRTADYGLTWDTIEYDLENQIDDFKYVSGDTIIARAIKEKQGGIITTSIYTSLDNGVTWKFTSLPSNISQFEFYNSSRGLGLEYDGSIFTTIDGGDSWSPTGINQNILSFNISGDRIGSFANDNGQNYITTDFFKTYVPIACGKRMSGLPQILNDSSLLIVLRNIPEYPNYNSRIAKLLHYQTNNCSNRIDNDGDGFSIEEDCNDQNPAINPEAIEIADNGIDDNCDGSILTSTTNLKSDFPFQLFPNPSFDVMYFKSDGYGNVTVDIYNITGVQVLHKDDISELTIENLSQGIYFVKVLDKSLNKYWVKKVVMM